MKPLSKDAKGFIEGVTSYIRDDAHGSRVLPRVSALLTKVTSAAKKERTASVISAIPLSDNEKSSVSRVLAKILEHDVACQYAVDPTLLGGIKVAVADWVVDTSLSGQLGILSGALL
jgi:F-type H+-transporting ATPase subunit delta